MFSEKKNKQKLKLYILVMFLFLELIFYAPCSLKSKPLFLCTVLCVRLSFDETITTTKYL